MDKKAVLGITGCAALLAACQSQEVSSSGGGCTSHYEIVASAPSLPSLKAKLRENVRSEVESLKTVGREGDKRIINLLNAKRRTVIEVDVWKKADGSWVAGQWSQCID